eukprot:scaffold12944_cov23-Tisochrysis_lutea.AAC.1
MSRQLTMSTRAHSIDSWDSRSLADNMAGKMGLSSQGEERTHRCSTLHTYCALCSLQTQQSMNGSYVLPLHSPMA